MKVGDKVRVIKLLRTDAQNTDLRLGDTGVVYRVDDAIVQVKLDRNILHDIFCWNPESETYDFYYNQLEVIESAKTVTITEDDFMRAAADVMAHGSASVLLKGSPITAHVFSVFAAEITAKLFFEEEDK